MSNYDVSYVFKIFDKFSPAIKEMRKSLGEFQDGIEEVEKKVKSTNSSFKKFTESVGHMGRTLTTRLTAPLIAAGMYAIKNSSDFRTAELSIQAFTGSAQDAAVIMEDIKKKSMEMPLSMEELSSAASMLLQTGTMKSELPQRLEEMSVMAIATDQNIASLTKRLSKFHVLGSAPPRSFARIMPALIQELRSMATQAGLTQKQIDKLFGGGTKLGWSEIQKAMSSMTEEGGEFYEVMIAKSNLWENILKEIHNDFRIMASDIGDVILDFFGIDGSMKTLNEKLQILTSGFHDFLKNHKGLVQISLAVLAIAAALGPVLISLSAILNIVAVLNAPILIITAGIALMAIGIYKAYKQFVWLYDHSVLFKKVIDWIIAKIEKLYGWLLNIEKVILNSIGRTVGFNVKANVEVDKSQLTGMHATMTNQIQGGKLSFAPMTHAINSTLDVNLNAPPGTVKNVRAGGDSTVKFNLGQNMTFARGHV